MSKTFIQQQIRACSDPYKAAANISFNMIHRSRTVSAEELQRRRDDLALIIQAASPTRAADQILGYMSSRQLIFLESSSPEPLVQGGSPKSSKSSKPSKASKASKSSKRRKTADSVLKSRGAKVFQAFVRA